MNWAVAHELKGKRTCHFPIQEYLDARSLLDVRADQRLYILPLGCRSFCLIISSTIQGGFCMSAAVHENGVSEEVTVSPNEGTASRQDPRSLTNLNEILSCLSSFQSEEAELSNSLTELLSAREPIVASLSRLQSLVPHLDELHLEASMLSDKVSSTAQTADRVGGKVRSLDEEMRRVRESAERVGQVMELKVIAALLCQTLIHILTDLL